MKNWLDALLYLEKNWGGQLPCWKWVSTLSRPCPSLSRKILRKIGNFMKEMKKIEYIPGMHLYTNHNKRDFGDFNKHYELTILEKCSPSTLDVKEHFWIQKLRTLNPLGLNSVDPFGLPLLV